MISTGRKGSREWHHDQETRNGCQQGTGRSRHGHTKIPCRKPHGKHTIVESTKNPTENATKFHGKPNGMPRKMPYGGRDFFRDMVVWVGHVSWNDVMVGGDHRSIMDGDDSTCRGYRIRGYSTRHVYPILMLLLMIFNVQWSRRWIGWGMK